MRSSFIVRVLLVGALICLFASPAMALTGSGLPSGCSGGESRYDLNYPYDWEKDGSHLRLVYKLPAYNWCWISHHGRVYTDDVQGGSDAWTAVLREGYYSSGRDRLEVLVPKTFWMPYYAYYRYVIGFSRTDSYDMIADLFWVWAYHD